MTMLSELKVGDRVKPTTDGYRSCLDIMATYTVLQGPGALYVDCKVGRHFFHAGVHGELMGFELIPSDQRQGTPADMTPTSKDESHEP